MTVDPYNAAYDRGYADGLAGRVRTMPGDDTDVNYADGYFDGVFKRKCDAEDSDGAS